MSIIDILAPYLARTLSVMCMVLLFTTPSTSFSITNTNFQEPVEQPLQQSTQNPDLLLFQEQKIKQQRKLFLKAEKAAKLGKRKQFRTLVNQLKKYPLYPYLIYADLKRRIHSAKPGELETFVTQYSDSPLAYRLRRSRLFFLARNKKWNEYLAFYQPTENIRLKCHYHRALIQTGLSEKSFSDINDLWLSGRSLPKVCDPVLSYWKNEGKLVSGLVWDRIQLAMKAGRSKLAKHLAEYLPAKEQHWVETWYQIHHRPSKILNKKVLRGQHPIITSIVVHGMKRLARYNPSNAVNTWEKIKSRIELSAAQQAEVFKAIGKSFHRRNMPEALTWLGNIPEEFTDQRIRESRIRITLKTEDWNGSLHWINQLNEQEQTSERWQYWRARALEGIGKPREAGEIYSQIARARGYESFLAAEKISVPYQFLHNPLNFTKKELYNLKNTPGFLRARELLAINRLLDARREWYTATQNLDDRSLQMAAKIASEWNWHDRSILTLGQSSYRDDLDIRFPIVHKEKVLRYASHAKIKPAWAFSIMRQESAFALDARSHRNARGLMQLLPRTARAVARSLKTKLRRTSDLHKADINIRFGITYLKKVSLEFDNNLTLATAAYNAGEYRVRKWLPKDQNIATDIWIETIPFTETRNYLRNVLAYTLIYEHRLGKQLTPLSQHMLEITPKNRSTVMQSGGASLSGKFPLAEKIKPPLI